MNDQYDELWNWCRSLQDRIEVLEKKADEKDAMCRDPQCQCRLKQAVDGI